MALILSFLGLAMPEKASATTPGTVIAWGYNGNGQTSVPAGLTNAIAVAGGGSHSLALQSNGTVVAWGWNGSGQTNVPSGLTNVMAIAAGNYHSLALKGDGTVVAWGYNGSGQTTVPAGLTNVMAIAAGGYHSLALKRDGTVVAWGYNYYGQASVPAGLTNVIAVAAGGFHSLALKGDGTVVAWGVNWSGETSVPAGLTNVIAVAAGGYHSLALKGDGKVVAWGDNYYGETIVPAGLTNVIAVAAGANHSLALKGDGTVVAWGYNGSGQTTVPAGLTNVMAIAGGDSHSLALNNGSPAITGQPASTTLSFGSTATFSVSASGSALSYFWMKNGVRLNDGGKISGARTSILTITNVLRTDAASYSVIVSNSLGSVTSASAALTVLDPVITADPQPSGATYSPGASVTFTANAAGTGPLSFRWQYASSWPNFLDLTDGANISGATTTNLTVRNLSQANNAGYYRLVVSNSYGTATSGYAYLYVYLQSPNIDWWHGEPQSHGASLGLPTDFTVQPSSGSLPLSYQWRFNGNNIYNATTSTLHLNAVQRADQGSYTVVVSNPGGSLESLPAVLTPVNVAEWGGESYYGTYYYPVQLSNTVAIAAQSDDLLALKPDGSVFSLVYPSDLTNVTAIAGGYAHALALKTDGSVVAWGDNSYGQTNVPSGLSNVVAIAAGDYHSLAVKSDGTVKAWGLNSSNQCKVPSGLKNVVAVAGRGSHSLALKSDGTVVGWGSQTNVPLGLSNVMAIAAGGSHSLALRTDGTVVAWGDNSHGQTNLPESLNYSPIIQISAGGNQNLALTAWGSVIAWGDNYYGQTNVPSRLADGEVQVSQIAAGSTRSWARISEGQPAITIQPFGQQAQQGASTTLRVASINGWYCQWQFNGTNIDGATDSTFTPNTQLAGAGNYTVVIDNYYGSVTSQVAVLSIIPDSHAPSVSISSPANKQSFANTGATQVTAPLCNFWDYPDVSWAPNGLTHGADGNFYGTADGGIFMLTPSGTLTNVYSFRHVNDPNVPSTPLVQAGDGSFYGASLQGGSNGFGSVFKVTTNGALSLLYSFGSQWDESGTFYSPLDGVNPVGNLVLGRDGNLYGIAFQGGTNLDQWGNNNSGLAFKLTTNGIFSILHSFGAIPNTDNEWLGPLDGALPLALVRGNDGDLYGLTSYGGTNGYGTFFKLTTEGAFTTLYHSSVPFGGFDPNSWGAAQNIPTLVSAADGSFYGTTSGNGWNDGGTIFKLTTDGTFTNLHSFASYWEGSNPNGPLLQGVDGNLYGTTAAGGDIGYGTLFRMTPAGTVTFLYSFGLSPDWNPDSPDPGATPCGPLARGPKGSIYGTSWGNFTQVGTAFKLQSAGNLITLTGSASDDTKLQQVLVSLNGGPFTNAVVTNTTAKAATWGCPLLLDVGTNNVVVKSKDQAGNESPTATRSFFLEVPSLFQLRTNVGGNAISTVSSFGTPTNAAMLLLDRSYTVQAKADPNFQFRQWDIVSDEGTSSSTNSKLTFTMKGGLVLTANFNTNAPVIKQQPKNLTLLQGQVATFQLTAVGAGLTYQWQHNGALIPGATASAYTNLTVNLVDAGTYSLVVSNGGGVLVSSNAVLTVNRDTVRPTVSFASPANKAEIAPDGNPIILIGTAADNARVTQVWLSLNNSAFTSLSITNKTPASATWGIPLTLIVGTNTVRAYSVDYMGNFSLTNSRTFFWENPSLFTLVTNGSGTITPTQSPMGMPTNQAMLHVTRSYTVTAAPGPNCLFSNWVWSACGVTNLYTDAKLTFIMQTNLTLTANFVTNQFIAAAGTYNGLVCATNNIVALESAGFFNVTVSSQNAKPGAFSGKLQLDGDAWSFSGAFNIAGQGVLPKAIDRSSVHKPALTLILSLPADGSDKIIGTLAPADGAWSSALSGNRAVFSSTNSTSLAGTNTFAIPGSTDAAHYPGGDGYGSVTVGSDGKITLAGVAGDGAVLGQSVGISKNGDWPFYNALYQNSTTKQYQGAIQGWLTLSSQGVSGTVRWIKRAVSTDALYPAGFTNDPVAIIGSTYINPAAGVRALDLTNGLGLVLLEDGNLSIPMTNKVVLGFDNKFPVSITNTAGVTNKLTLSLATKTGVITGSFLRGSATNTFSGVLLQKQKIGAGYFKGSSQSGLFSLENRP